MFGGDYTTQYVYGKDGPNGQNRNKMYACLPNKKKEGEEGESKTLLVRRLFSAFGATFRQNIYKNSFIKEACFTYHSGAEGKYGFLRSSDVALYINNVYTGYLWLSYLLKCV